MTAPAARACPEYPLAMAPLDGRPAWLPLSLPAVRMSVGEETRSPGVTADPFAQLEARGGSWLDANFGRREDAQIAVDLAVAFAARGPHRPTGRIASLMRN